MLCKKVECDDVHHLNYSRILQKLGVIIWKLKYPMFLDSKAPIKLYQYLRLLLVSDVPILLNDLFVRDVIRAMNISVKEVCIMNVHQIKYLILPVKFHCCCWWIGVKKIKQFTGASLSTPSLSILKNNADAKRDLWHQISYNLDIFNNN